MRGRGDFGLFGGGIGVLSGNLMLDFLTLGWMGSVHARVELRFVHK
jgi:hypothetical protein